MGRFWRWIIGWQLIILLLLFFVPGTALAKADRQSLTLEQAIRIVKDNFNIPEGFTKFNSSYNDYDNRSIWSLNWEATGGQGGSLYGEVDAVNGEIISMRIWEYGGAAEEGLQLPAISAAEAQKIATELVERLLPQRLDELKLLPAGEQIIPLGRQQVDYSVRWRRIVNGIPVNGDGVTVEVRGDNGQIVGYNFNWTRTNFPAAEGVISAAKAKQVFESNNMLEVQYLLADGGPMTEADKKQQPQLIYRLYHPSHGLIDALQGEPLLLETGQGFMEGGAGGMGEMTRDMNQKSVSQAEVPLSPEELQEIERTAKLLSQEEAVSSLKKWIKVPANLTLRSANLMAAWQEPETRIWNLHWDINKAEADQPRYFSGRINAATGELMGFDTYYDSLNTNKGGSIDRGGARKIAEGFLKKVQPQRFQQVKLDTKYTSDWDAEPLKEGQNPRIQRFNYRRVVNDVVFPANGMNIAVDTVTKQVFNYNLEWRNVDFPTPEGALTEQQASSAFLDKRPLDLMYTQIYGAEAPGQMRLVYQPTVPTGQPSFDLIDAWNGEPLDWQGKPLARQPRVYYFNDIEGNFAVKEINLLGRAGIFGEYGDVFHPDEEITMVSLLRAMLMANDGPWGISELNDEEILKKAKERKWLQEEAAPKDLVNRETLAKLMIRMLNLERAAKVEGIYKTPYGDGAAFSSETIGYAALSWGLGIIRGDGVNFKPEHAVNRAEAAAALVRALTAKN